jgi:hypothetical protein
MAAKKYDLEGAAQIAEYFGIPIDTLVVDWRRFDPPVPLHRKDAIIYANKKEIGQWIEQMGIKTREL